jgi:hypothetical protein
MDDRTLPNAISVKVDGEMYLILLAEDGGFLDIPPIPITDVERVYEDMEESRIFFVNVEFENMDPDDTSFNMEKMSYAIRDLFSIVLAKGDDKTPITVKQYIDEGGFIELIKNVYLDALEQSANTEDGEVISG